ncbi:hypothetical protein, partial [Tautonia rosea]|uniref:hypothetical protein n=1 Tax=Tautonia rosea TaxID=2728037 RepID=UPI0014741244
GDPNLYRYVGNGPTNFVDPDGLRGIGSWISRQAEWVGEQASSAWDYTYRSGEQLILGHYSDEVTVLGTAGQIGTGLIGVDLPGDIRDLSYDVTHWEWSWQHAGQTGLDLVGVFPVIGALKYTDEAVTLARGGSRARAPLADRVAARADARHAESCTVTTRIDVLPSNQLVSRFDTVTIAPNRTAWSRISSDYRAVIRDVEAHTRRSIPSVQRRQLSNQIRQVNHRQPVSDDVYRRLQAEYRDSRSTMIEAWERNTGQSWPQGAQAHHIIPSRYGGPNKWWNIHPAYRNVHQPGIHGSGSPTQTVFPTPLPRN